MWIGSITIGWEGDKRIRKTVSAKTGTGVREKLRVVQAKIDAGLPRGDDKLTVHQLLDRWFNDVMRHQVASPALLNYETIAKIHIRPTLGRKQVSKLKPAEIDALLSARPCSAWSYSAWGLGSSSRRQRRRSWGPCLVSLPGSVRRPTAPRYRWAAHSVWP
jgi:hypothetical protein